MFCKLLSISVVKVRSKQKISEFYKNIFLYFKGNWFCFIPVKKSNGRSPNKLWKGEDLTSKKRPLLSPLYYTYDKRMKVRSLVRNQKNDCAWKANSKTKFHLQDVVEVKFFAHHFIFFLLKNSRTYEKLEVRAQCLCPKYLK